MRDLLIKFVVAGSLLSIILNPMKPNASGSPQSKGACESALTKSYAALFPGLTPYWAQNLVGADFAKSLLEASAKRPQPLKKVKIVNVDGGMDPRQVDVSLIGKAATYSNKFGDNSGHGDKVLNVLAGRGEYGVGDFRFVQIADALTYAVASDGYEYSQPESADQINAAKEFEKVLRAELTRLSPEIQELRKLDATLTAEGWPEPLAKVRAENERTLTNVILDAMKQSDPEAFNTLMNSLPNLMPASIKIQLQYTDESTSTFFSGRVAEMASEILSSHPDILNFEVQIIAALRGANNIALNKFLRDVSKSTIVVSAAGNVFQAEIFSNAPLIHGADVVVVGNLLSSGLTDPSSSASGDVNIMAPAGSELLSHLQHLDATSPDTFDERFGGTSGATPIVSGALANAVAILGRVTPAQAKALLQATAIPLPYSGEGTGMLDGYRLLAYAIRLKNAGWPLRADELFKNQSLRNFKSEANSLRHKLAKLSVNANCEIEMTKLQLLRRIFLLDPQTLEANFLADEYSHLGFSQDAKFYEIFAASPLERKRIAKNMSTLPAGKAASDIDNDLIKRNPRFFNGF